jgi:hypothetical protein
MHGRAALNHGRVHFMSFEDAEQGAEQREATADKIAATFRRKEDAAERDGNKQRRDEFPLIREI